MEALQSLEQRIATAPDKIKSEEIGAVLTQFESLKGMFDTLPPVFGGLNVDNLKVFMMP